MTARDGIGVALGASLSFFLGLLATEKHPEHVLRWGLGVSLTLLAIFWLWELARGPWISVHATPILAVADGIVLSVGLNNHGRRATDEKIVDLLIPDSIPMSRCKRDGSIPDDALELLPTPESVDGVSESHYWHGARPLPPGTLLLYLRIGCGTDEFVMRANIDERRRDFQIDPRNLNLTQEQRFATIRPAVSRSMQRAARLAPVIGRALRRGGRGS